MKAILPGSMFLLPSGCCCAMVVGVAANPARLSRRALIWRYAVEAMSDKVEKYVGITECIPRMRR